jgi:hypothetical protein
MVTSRSVPQQTEQMFSPFAGQYLFALRFWQIGQANDFSQRARLTEFCGIRPTSFYEIPCGEANLGEQARNG